MDVNKTLNQNNLPVVDGNSIQVNKNKYLYHSRIFIFKLLAEVSSGPAICHLHLQIISTQDPFRGSLIESMSVANLRKS